MSRDVSAFYQAYRSGRPPAVSDLELQHIDFVLWHRRWVESRAIAAQLSYWRGQLAGLPVLELPADRTRPSAQTGNGATLIVPIPARIADGVQRLSGRGARRPSWSCWLGSRRSSIDIRAQRR